MHLYAQESEEQLRAAIARLKKELDAVQALGMEGVGAARVAVAGMQRLEGLSDVSTEKMSALQQQLSLLEAHSLKVGTV